MNASGEQTICPVVAVSKEVAPVQTRYLQIRLVKGDRKSETQHAGCNRSIKVPDHSQVRVRRRDDPAVLTLVECDRQGNIDVQRQGNVRNGRHITCAYSRNALYRVLDVNLRLSSAYPAKIDEAHVSR